jgi:hypothetical protein
MFLARIVTGREPQVYPLTGCLYFPRAWRFVSYGKGAAAIDATQTAALSAARRLTERHMGLSGESPTLHANGCA